jgi:hypothetical protein
VIQIGVAAAQNSADHSPQAVDRSVAMLQARKLVLSEIISFPISPPMALLSRTKCDGKGNIYLTQTGAPPNLLGSGGLSTVPITKLSVDSKTTLAFPLPTIDRFRGVLRTDFGVNADGDLFALLEALDASPANSEGPPSYFIAKYRADGSIDWHFRIEAAARHLQPFRFALFGNGNILLTGTTAVEGQPLHPFVAVFDKDGRFVRDVLLRDRPNKAAANAPTEEERGNRESGRAITLSSSSMIESAPDGNVYLLRDETQPRIYTISPLGEVIRSFRIYSPTPSLTATNFAVTSDGKIEVTFSQVQGASAPPSDSEDVSNIITVVDSRSGEVSAVYQFPKASTSLMPACAASSTAFLFLGTSEDGQHQQVAKYSPQN